ncbi:hypothetical protein HPB47_017809 [Ixodes persulcatus]|uniref:Uncharacterized protein n=1 Tax=Ixodes persulcatus TaxID=34615 RepID=A0AC60QMC2_IXOPE|nr:hypothetical protein HPB47_017809 [Ixodes persulcatus]
MDQETLRRGRPRDQEGPAQLRNPAEEHATKLAERNRYKLCGGLQGVQILDLLQEAVDTTKTYAEEVGLSCAAEKSELLGVRSRAPSNKKEPDIDFHLKGLAVPRVNKLRVLGLHLQSNGKAAHMVHSLRKQAMQTAHLIRRVSNRKGGLRERDTIHIFRALIVSHFTYHTSTSFTLPATIPDHELASGGLDTLKRAPGPARGKEGVRVQALARTYGTDPHAWYTDAAQHRERAEAAVQGVTNNDGSLRTLSSKNNMKSIQEAEKTAITLAVSHAALHNNFITPHSGQPGNESAHALDRAAAMNRALPDGTDWEGPNTNTEQDTTDFNPPAPSPTLTSWEEALSSPELVGQRELVERPRRIGEANRALASVS